MPIEVAVDERTKPFLDAGRDAFFRRQGQLNLACAQCHDEQLGQEARRQPDPAGASRPAIRSTGSSGRASARCSGACATASIGMRAEPYAYGAPEFVDLELYLMWRARGMKMEIPRRPPLIT